MIINISCFCIIVFLVLYLSKSNNHGGGGSFKLNDNKTIDRQISLSNTNDFNRQQFNDILKNITDTKIYKSIHVFNSFTKPCFNSQTGNVQKTVISSKLLDQIQQYFLTKFNNEKKKFNITRENYYIDQLVLLDISYTNKEPYYFKITLLLTLQRRNGNYGFQCETDFIVFNPYVTGNNHQEKFEFINQTSQPNTIVIDRNIWYGFVLDREEDRQMAVSKKDQIAQKSIDRRFPEGGNSNLEWGYYRTNEHQGDNILESKFTKWNNIEIDFNRANFKKLIDSRNIDRVSQLLKNNQNNEETNDIIKNSWSVTLPENKARCFTVNGDIYYQHLDKTSCQSSGGVWDKPCVENTDCPFWNSGNTRGGCQKEGGEKGFCEMPQNIKRIGYTHFRDGYFPYCRDCDTSKYCYRDSITSYDNDKIKIGKHLCKPVDTCCDQPQQNNDSGPKYVFP